MHTAFMRLAKQLQHPDKGGSAERFRQVCNAYQKLIEMFVNRRGLACSRAYVFLCI